MVEGPHWRLQDARHRSSAEQVLGHSGKYVWLPPASDPSAEAVLEFMVEVSAGDTIEIHQGCRRPWGGEPLRVTVRGEPDAHDLANSDWPADVAEWRSSPLRVSPGVDRLRLLLHHRGAEALGLAAPVIMRGTASNSEETFVSAVRGRLVEGTSWVLRGGDRRAAIGEIVAVDRRGRASLRATMGRVRLYHPIPHPTSAGWLRLRWMMVGPPIVDVAIHVRSNEDGRWREVVRLPMATGRCRLSLPPSLPEGRLALVVEPGEGELPTLGHLSVGSESEPPPYAPNGPAELRFLLVHRELPRLAQCDEVAAARAELDVARRLGLFDRVGELHDDLVRRDPDIVWNDAEVRGLCRTWIAVGRDGDLRRMLADRADLVEEDDALAAMARRLAFRAGEPIGSAFLPSGRRDYALAAEMPDLARLPDPRWVDTDFSAPGITAADALVLADYWCGRNEAKWLGWLGTYFTIFGLGSPTLRPGPEPAALRLRFPSPERPQPMDHPSVSVVMAAHDAERTVDAAIATVLEQSLPHVQILVCDDCSTDGTLGRLRRYVGHRRVRVFASRANQGTYNIRNALIPLADGALIGFQDSDDTSHPLRLEHQWRTLLAGAAVSVCSHVRMTSEGRVVVFADQRAARAAPVTALAEKAAFLASGLFRHASVGADTENLERIAEGRGAGAVVTDPRPMLVATWGRSSLTRREDTAQTEDGYVAPGRRAYRAALAKRRVYGPQVVSDGAIDDVLRRAGLYREPTGVDELTHP